MMHVCQDFGLGGNDGTIIKCNNKIDFGKEIKTN